jgi:hypothetical protein
MLPTHADIDNISADLAKSALTVRTPSTRRPSPAASPLSPGDAPRLRRIPSDYRLRLLEKQRLRHQYDVRERQLHRVVDEAFRNCGGPATS